MFASLTLPGIAMYYNIPMTYDERYSRNIGIISATNQEKIKSTHVAVAGCGGDGGLIAIMLARLGIGSFTLADPETFGIENINRQAGSTTQTVGKNKAETIADQIKLINPEAGLKIYPEGLTAENVRPFVSEADIVIDEMEYTMHHLGVMLAREARQQGKVNVMGLNVGFGCLLTSFNPNGTTLEEYLGIDPEMDIKEVDSAEVPLERWVPKIPKYIDMDVFQKVANGEISAPTVSPGVALAAGYTVTEIYNHITGHQEPIWAPKVLWADALEHKVEIINS